MRTSAKAVLVLFLMMMCWSAYSAASDTTAFTSLWGDYKTNVPPGWQFSSDYEGSHYTNINFKSPEPYYRISIRWFTYTAPTSNRATLGWRCIPAQTTSATRCSSFMAEPLIRLGL